MNLCFVLFPSVLGPIMDFNHLKLQSTPDNSNLLGKSQKVRVIETTKQITGNKEIRKWMGKECKYHAYFTSKAGRNKGCYYSFKIFPQF